ncbi:Ger(x)C family spore germination protein [Ammoniphilus sp. CFH 90114]|uniref:Ger(x)C family spore germination protein n=1 Tax=Ammoniphilus sp. CFH 90114 TaxID=2493665 RepID=UPI00100DA446|nr:Ger(x)C family spore germination protein [Ammoniphilus sp. CFH 90114]RXT04902.1 Ger(x)C family spore germination protein [Ammoniphilus sp. CFH 90114]
MRILLLLMVASLLLPGCGFKDIDKRYFVVNIGIDKPESEQEKYKVILKLAIPTGEIKSGESEFILVEQEAKTIAEAVRLIKSTVDKELDFSHAKAIIIGKEMLERDMEELTDWMMRRRDIQKIAYMATGVPDAKTILEIKPKSERLPSNALFLTFGGEGSESIYTVTVYLFDFRRRLFERGVDAILPVIEANKDLLKINKTVVFDGGGVKKLFLTPAETKVIHPMITTAHIRRTNVIVEQGDWKFVANVEHIEADYQVEEKEKGEVIIKVTYSMEGIIEESNRSIKDNQLRDVERLIEKEMKKQIKEVLTKLQKEKFDPVGFGLAYMAQSFDNEHEWDQWRGHLYQNADFDIQVKTKVLGSGVIH